MQYSNFIMKNNVHATLSTALSSIATTIQLTTGQGARFGTEFPQIATLESFDGDGKVVKREIVQITARNDDDLTVVRAFAPCPANDDANSQSQSSFSFSADDQISLYIPKEIFDGIKKSLNDIYNNGTNNMRTDVVSGLQVEVNPGSVLVGSAYYDFVGGTITLTDNATNYLEIDEDGLLVNNTTSRHDENTKIAIITTSSGSVTNIKDRRLGTIGGKIGGVNIHDLTEKTSLSPDDEFIVSDSDNIWNNKKIKSKNVPNINSLEEKKYTNFTDLILIEDSEDGYKNKKISVDNFIMPTIIQKGSSSIKLGSSDDPKYYILYDTDGYFYVYNNNICKNNTMTGSGPYIFNNTSGKVNFAFIYEGYIYILSTTMQKIAKCSLTADNYSDRSNWTISNYGSSFSNYFIGMLDGYIYGSDVGNISTIQKFDINMNAISNISFPTTNLNPNTNACITSEGFYIINAGNSTKYFIPLAGGSCLNVRFNYFDLGGHYGHLYGHSTSDTNGPFILIK